MEKPPKKLPHLLVPASGKPYAFSSPGSFAGEVPPDRNRAIHAALLERRLLDAQAAVDRRAKAQVARGGAPSSGNYIEFASEPGHSLALKSLEAKRQGIEVVAVREEDVVNGERAETVERATVFVPQGKLAYFVEKVKAYAFTDVPSKKPNVPPKPANQKLVAGIADIRPAVLGSLWTDEPGLLPAPGVVAWWEVWLRGEGVETRDCFATSAAAFGIKVGATLLTFPACTVVLASATPEQMSASVELLDQIAELRLAKETAYEMLAQGQVEQGEWVKDLKRRIVPPPPDAPAVCILDTGVNRGHPLLSTVLLPHDCQSVDAEWGVDDHHGHGTLMAGLAAYGDLVAPLQSTQPVALEHCLESIKILPPAGQNHPEQYGKITAEAIARAEIEAPARQRSVCLAVTTTDSRDRGQPSSWSGELDKLASGYDDGERRLILVSAGNSDLEGRETYPANTQTEGIHDPGQAWNALTVGAYTNKVSIRNAEAGRGWKPLAPAGSLSPTSTTGVAWASAWAHKPDIVTEGGNLGVDPFSGKALTMESLSLLTTNAEFGPPNPQPLAPMCETSAAVAQASRMAAIIQARYPEAWPETVRALLVHSAEWTPAMSEGRARWGTNEKRNLMRSCGFGVPNLERALWSAKNALTLMVQDEIQPYNGGEMKELKIFSLPWPRAELERLGPAEVRLKVSLSYFIEPNPARRGWRDRYRYASHGLRFEMMLSTESEANFRKRINKADREDKADRSRSRDTEGWFLGPDLRAHGSIHSDEWTGLAAVLARRNKIAVYPTGGWWKERLKAERSNRKARFALLVSIETAATGVDVYTPVETALKVPIEQEIS